MKEMEKTSIGKTMSMRLNRAASVRKATRELLELRLLLRNVEVLFAGIKGIIEQAVYDVDEEQRAADGQDEKGELAIMGDRAHIGERVGIQRGQGECQIAGKEVGHLDGQQVTCATIGEHELMITISRCSSCPVPKG